MVFLKKPTLFGDGTGLFGIRPAMFMEIHLVFWG